MKTPAEMRVLADEAGHSDVCATLAIGVDGIDECDCSPGLLATALREAADEVERLQEAYDQEWANATRNLVAATKAAAKADQEEAVMPYDYDGGGYVAELLEALRMAGEVQATYRTERDAALAERDRLRRVVSQQGEDISDYQFGAQRAVAEIKTLDENQNRLAREVYEARAEVERLRVIILDDVSALRGLDGLVSVAGVAQPGTWRHEHAAAIRERDEARAERDAALAELAQVKGERDRMIAEVRLLQRRIASSDDDDVSRHVVGGILGRIADRGGKELP